MEKRILRRGCLASAVLLNLFWVLSPGRLGLVQVAGVILASAGLLCLQEGVGLSASLSVAARRQNEKQAVVHLFLYYLFILYAFLLNDGMVFARHTYVRGVNLVPRLLLASFAARPTGLQLWGNLALFMPFAFFLPYLFPAQRRPAVFAPTVCFFSVLVEWAQYLLQRGYADMDDVVLNTVGALAAWLLLQAFFSVLSRRGNQAGYTL